MIDRDRDISERLIAVNMSIQTILAFTIHVHEIPWGLQVIIVLLGLLRQLLLA